MFLRPGIEECMEISVITKFGCLSETPEVERFYSTEISVNTIVEGVAAVGTKSEQ